MWSKRCAICFPTFFLGVIIVSLSNNIFSLHFVTLSAVLLCALTFFPPFSSALEAFKVNVECFEYFFRRVSNGWKYFRRLCLRACHKERVHTKLFILPRVSLQVKINEKKEFYFRRRSSKQPP